MVSARAGAASAAGLLAASLLLLVALHTSDIATTRNNPELPPPAPAAAAGGGAPVGAPAAPRRALLAAPPAAPTASGIMRRTLEILNATTSKNADNKGGEGQARAAAPPAPVTPMFRSDAWFEREISLDAAEELRPKSCRIVDPDPCMAPIPPYKDRLNFPGTNGHMQGGPGYEATRKAHRGRILSLLTNLERIKVELGEAISVLDKERPIVIMPVNEGYLPLFLNFLESCRRAGVKIKEQIVVFPSSQALHEKIVAMGFVSFWSDALVTKRISEKASGFYGDGTFLDMMWVKTVSVYLILQLKRNLIFQDTDMVWLKDPVPYINDANCVHEGEESDAIFQHDGATARRFAPYFACSGFFFLKANVRVKDFWSSVLYSDLTWFWRSQQAPINYALAGSCRVGLRVNILCEETFVNGKVMINLEKGKRTWEDVRPIVAHVNWTLNMTDKLSRMKRLGLWLIEEPDPAALSED